MLKYATALLALSVSTTAFAGEFKILKEHKYFSPEGAPMFNGVSSYSEESFKPKGSSYTLSITEKIMTSQGRLVSGVTHEGGEFSADDIRLMGSVFSSCTTAWKGQIESITLKAGTFQACKRTYRNFTEWHIEGFPFPVKTELQGDNGSSVVYEALEVKISK